MNKLKLHVFTDDVDSYVAEKIEELPELICTHCSDSYEDMTGVKSYLECWEQVHDEKKLSIFFDSREVDFEKLKIVSIKKTNGKAPYAEWDVSVIAKAKHFAEWNGKGFLCSTEY